MPVRRRTILIAGGAALAAALGAVLLFRPRATVVEMAVVTRGPLAVTVDEEGTTRVRRHEDVNAPVGGRFVPGRLRVGDRVARGDVLGTLAPVPLDAEATRQAEARAQAADAAVEAAAARERAAQATFDEAQRILGRRDKLAAAGGIATEELERARLDATNARDARAAARSQLEAARAERSAARAVLEVRRGGGASRPVEVRAPIAGVLMRLVEEHERIVAAGMPLAQVGDPADLELVVPLLTADALKVKPGARVEFSMGRGDSAGRAVVSVVEPAAFTKLSPLGVQEQRVNIIATVAGPAVGVGDAFRVEARVVIAELPEAVIVPSSALVRHGESWSAWVVTGGRASQRPVVIGARAREGVEVRSGVSPGDTVVAYPPERLRDGTRVRRGADGS